MSVKITQVDAFADRPFAGNPAAVCVLPRPASEKWMQDVAREMNLSETAFLLPLAEKNTYQLRWFAPNVEVDLCGHATLASAHVLWEDGHALSDDVLQFTTKSGRLTAVRRGETIELDFPACPATEIPTPPNLQEALKAAVLSTHTNSMDLLVELASEADVRAIQPDFGMLKTHPVRGVMVTARSRKL